MWGRLCVCVRACVHMPGPTFELTRQFGYKRKKGKRFSGYIGFLSLSPRPDSKLCEEKEQSQSTMETSKEWRVTAGDRDGWEYRKQSLACVERVYLRKYPKIQCRD